MLPGTPQIIKCPSCGNRQQRETLTSGNTFGAKFYSDGKRIAPMLPEFPYFVKCPACGVFFKINDLVIDGIENSGESSETQRVAWFRGVVPSVQFLTVDEYRQAISNGLYNTEVWEKDLLSLRTSLWRAFNDRVRSGGTLSADEKIVYDDNCREILSLMTEDSDDESCLMRAEIYRNLGEFNTCKSLLRKIAQPDKYERYISSIIAECDAKSTLTVCIN